MRYRFLLLILPICIALSVGNGCIRKRDAKETLEKTETASGEFIESGTEEPESVVPEGETPSEEFIEFGTEESESRVQEEATPSGDSEGTVSSGPPIEPPEF